jgi:GET complex subunit GET2
MSSSSPSSAAEQARLRRERREKKILAQGSSRLEKIAGLQGGATAREALHPDPPELDISSLDDSVTSSTGVHRSPDPTATATATTRDHSHAVSPGRNIFGVDGGDEDPFNMLTGGNDPFANLPEELKNDPMMRLLLNNPLFSQGIPSASSSGGAGLGGTSRESSSEDLNRLAEKINKQLLGGLLGSQPSEEQVDVVPDTSIWKWKFIRMVSVFSVLLFLWGQMEDYHFSRNVDISNGIVYPFFVLANIKPIFYTFIVFSLSLQALRLILDQGRPLPGSIIATIGSVLPDPFGTVLIGFARYRMILTDLWEDFAVLLFGMGIIYWLKTR